MKNRRRSETKMEQYQIVVTILSPKAAESPDKNFHDKIFSLILAKEFLHLFDYLILLHFFYHFDGDFLFTLLISPGF